MVEATKQSLIRGLTSIPKYIPMWYRYDETGSELCQHITSHMPDYYMTMSTMSILHNNIQDITRLPCKPALVDMGSGDCSKTRLVIDELLKKQHKLVFYPVDISKEFLLKSAKELSAEYDESLVVKPIAADYVQGVEELTRLEGSKLILFFSSLQNMSYKEQVDTLRVISTIMTDKCRLIFSADITQNKEAVVKAYNDDAGLQQRFVTNSITRLNTEEGSEIDRDMFRYEVECIWDTSPHHMSYVRTYIQAKEPVLYPIPGLGIDLVMDKGERLYLHEGAGGSCKYTVEQLHNIIEKAGLCLEDTWTDEQKHAVFCRCKTV